MAGQRRMDGYVRRLAVADLANHDDIGILANKSTYRGGEGQANCRLDLRLIDARDLVFDRIFDGKDLLRRLVQDRQHGGKRRRLSASSRAGDEDQPMRQRQQTAQCSFIAGDQSDLAQVEQPSIARQQAYDHALAVLGRHGSDTNIDISPAGPRSRGSVLRQTAFRNVETSEDLDTRYDSLRRRVRRKRDGAENSVNSHTHNQSGPEWFDVDVAGSQFHRTLQQIVDGPHHGRPARQIAQAVDVVIAGPALGLRNIHGICDSLFEPPLEDRNDVVKGSDDDPDSTAADDFRGPDCGAVSRIRHGQTNATAAGAKWK